HCHYARNEILGAFDWDRPSRMRQGVMYDEAHRCDVFFVTLRKTEKEYSTRLYKDRPISPRLFEWESQTTTSMASRTGQRYIHHEARGSRVLLFVRESKRDAAGATMPYVFLGPAHYVSHEGDRPMAITWRLEHEMPARLFLDERAVTG